MTTLLLNGKFAKAESGVSIMEAARKNGAAIPALCQYDGHENGNCRLCMVEVKGSAKLVPSCSTTVRDGLVVTTDSERLGEYRKSVIAMLMRSHGTHEGEKESKCLLHAYASQYGIKESRTVSTESVADKSHPGIVFDPSLCIYCRKCVTACNEEQGNYVIGLADMGSRIALKFDGGVPLGESKCTSCGACVDVCPTAALIEEDWVKADETVKSVCPYCGVGCTVEYGIRENRIVWARGIKGVGINDGKLCVKGKFGFQFGSSSERLRKPLIRRSGIEKSPIGGRPVKEVFREVSWEFALHRIASRIKKIQDKFGTDSIGGIASDRSTNEDIYAFQKLMRATLGTDNVDQSATLCHSPSAAMLSWSLGTGAATNPIQDVLNSSTILVVGSNTDRAHPVISSYIKKASRQGSSLIVVDPRRVELANSADMFLQIRPGTDVFLFSAIAKYIVDSGTYDREYVRKFSEGFDEYLRSLAPFDLESAERITGIPAETIKKVAVAYSTAKPSSIFWTLGITEHRNGSDNVSSLVNLAILTGNIGIQGGGLNPLRGQNNVQGGADMGAFPGSLPGYQDPTDESVRQRFESAWKAKLPAAKGLKSTEMIQAALKGKIRGMYISGENSVRSHPNTSEVIAALKSLDFLVVQDLFLTETAELADVVLPAASAMEQEGTFTNTERRVQMVHKVLEPPKGAKPDWQIYSDLSQKLGYDLGFTESAGIMREMSELAPTWKGINYDRLQESGLQWPVHSENSQGTSLLHAGGAMRGKARFRPVSWHDLRVDRYPYVLITGRYREQYHTATMSSRSPVITRLTEGPVVEMNRDDMKRENVNENDMIEVFSKAGSIKARARSNENLQPGVMFTTFHFSELPANILTASEFDAITKTPAYKDTRVRILKARG